MKYLILALVILAGCSSQQPEYTSQEVSAPVNIIIINDSSCAECQNPDNILSSLREAEVAIGTIRRLEYKSEEGAQLVKVHNVQRVPSVLLSSQIATYPGIGASFLRSGIPAVGYYLLQSPPIYRELANGTIKGHVNVTFINDSNCQQCTEFEPIRKTLIRLGLVISKLTNVDANSTKGSQLLENYTITKIPTILLNGDVGMYTRLAQAWPEVGSIESDGTYVMRSMEPLGSGMIYRNLATNTIVNQTFS